MNRKNSFLILLSLIGVFMSSITLAGNILIVTEPWAPYEYFENGVAKGSDAEFVTEVLKIMGHSVEIKEFPWERCQKMIAEGKADGIISLYKNAEREQTMYFPTEPINKDENVLFVQKGKTMKYDGKVSSLKGSKMGYMNGFSVSEEFDSGAKNKMFEAVSFNKREDMIMAVSKGRVEYGVENRLVVLDAAKKIGAAEKIDILEPPVSSGELYIGFSKKSKISDIKKIAELFGPEAVKFKATPEYKKLVEKYGVVKIK